MDDKSRDFWDAWKRAAGRTSRTRFYLTRASNAQQQPNFTAALHI